MDSRYKFGDTNKFQVPLKYLEFNPTLYDDNEHFTVEIDYNSRFYVEESSANLTFYLHECSQIQLDGTFF